MRFHALAADFDGTLAADSNVDDATIESLKRLRKSGRRTVLVTGRLLSDLERVFPRLDSFDKIVAENGALLYDPFTREEQLLAEPADMRLVERLRERGVTPLDVGRVIVATWVPHDAVVLETIRDLGLDAQVIFNKGAVMVLPASVNKATGLRSALDALGLSLHSVVSIGDAENDLPFLRASEIGVAVANALDSVKLAADLTVSGERGDGVRELIERIIEDDFGDFDDLAARGIELGTTDSGPVRLRPYCGGVLLAGSSGTGKSTLATGFIERLGAAGYQYCLIDAEGDYDDLPDALVIGTPQQAPVHEEAVQLLVAGQNVVVQLLAVDIPERPRYFEALASRLGELRSASGRPHWIIMDEAHHFFPEDASAGSLYGHHSLFFITTKPALLARAALEHVDAVIAVGEQAAATITASWQRAGLEASAFDIKPPPLRGEALLSLRMSPNRAECFAVSPGKTQQRRHRRKYAHGDLAEEKSFFFTGPAFALKLRAQNLTSFLELGFGVDDETWEYHLRLGEYSTWIRESLGDEELAARVAQIEAEAGLTAGDSRVRIKDQIESCYTAPA